MNLDAEKILDAIHEFEEEPVAFVASPGAYRHLKLHSEADVYAEMHEDNPNLFGFEVHRDEALDVPNEQEVVLVFYEHEELLKYYDLPRVLRALYPFTKPGEPINGTVIEGDMALPSDCIKGRTKTLIIKPQETTTKAQ